MNRPMPVNNVVKISNRTVRKRVNWRQHAAGYLFLAPLLCVMAVFFVYAFYFLIRTSFQSTDISFAHPVYVGWKNFQLVLQDSRFYKSFFNNVVFAVVSILFSVTIGYVTAIFLQFKFKGVKLLQALLILPTLMPLALIATVFGMMLEYRYGTLNTFLRFVGLDSLALHWLGTPELAYGSVLFVSIYLIGLPLLYYTAELTTINPSILEAAVLDGAGLGRMLTTILYPLVRNSHKTIIISTMLGSFREFERVFLMTGGGPGNSTEIVSIYIYSQANRGLEMGIVAAASVLVLAFSFALAIAQIRLYRKR